jgi:hypothetical protein
MIHLDPNIEDSITWKLTNDGFYYSKSAYAMQFLGKMTSYMTSLVWKPWAPEVQNFCLVDNSK